MSVGGGKPHASASHRLRKKPTARHHDRRAPDGHATRRAGVATALALAVTRKTAESDH